MNEECTFTPSISGRSRKIASQVARDPQYRKSSSSRERAAALAKAETKKPAVSAVTLAIADRIKKTYGSLEEYHKQRREKALSYKDYFGGCNNESDDLKECTFQPSVNHAYVGSKAGEVKSVEGLEAFVKRLQAAREKRVKVQEEQKPGSGFVYTGEPTKVKPFSFLEREHANRARIRE